MTAKRRAKPSRTHHRPQSAKHQPHIHYPGGEHVNIVVGDHVLFGSPQGTKTRGIVLTVAAKSALVQPGAPLHNPITLCGSMFGLDVKRHRIFECSFPVIQPKCDHKIWTPRFACATNRTNPRKTVEVGVYRIPLKTQQQAMGLTRSLSKLSQAVPPAYAEYLGLQARLSFLSGCP